MNSLSVQLLKQRATVFVDGHVIVQKLAMEFYLGRFFKYGVGHSWHEMAKLQLLGLELLVLLRIAPRRFLPFCPFEIPVFGGIRHGHDVGRDEERYPVR